MNGVSEKMAEQGSLLALNPDFIEASGFISKDPADIAFMAATYVLRTMYEGNEIDNFGADPKIEELRDIIIKLTSIKGE